MSITSSRVFPQAVFVVALLAASTGVSAQPARAPSAPPPPAPAVTVPPGRAATKVVRGAKDANDLAVARLKAAFAMAATRR